METKRIKFKTAEYDEVTGVSKVVIETDLGTFTGVSRIHPDDLDFSSPIFGCRLAELRADRQYCLALARKYRAKADALNDFYKQMQNTRTFQNSAFYVKCLQRDIRHYMQLSVHWKTQAHRIKQVIAEDIKARDEYMKKQREAVKHV